MMELFLLELLAVAAVGLALGSFSTALIYRVPRGIPWAFGRPKAGDPKAGRSVCPSCKAVLGPLDLVPLFSWIFLGGKCRRCKTSIPARYPLIELGVVLSCVLAFLVYGPKADMVFIIAAVPFFMALLVIDLDHMILPDHLVLIAGLIGLIRLFYPAFVMPLDMDIVVATFVQALPFFYAAAAYAFLSWFLGLFLTKILKKESLGFGDVKFFAVAGLWLGFSGFSWFLILAGALGILFSLAWKKVKNEQVFPFGPALITSLYAVLLLQGSLFL